MRLLALPALPEPEPLELLVPRALLLVPRALLLVPRALLLVLPALLVLPEPLRRHRQRSARLTLPARPV
ncbi:MAG: hypothetical protein OXD31_13580 [Chloroflexi bacterium]|nr:hypothetical protein [Chloroflexota bacterium]